MFRVAVLAFVLIASHSVSETGRCAGSYWGTASWCTTTTTARRSWKGPSTSVLPSEILTKQWSLKQTQSFLHSSDPQLLRSDTFASLQGDRGQSWEGERPEHCDRWENLPGVRWVARGCKVGDIKQKKWISVPEQIFNHSSVSLCSGWFNVLSKVRVCTPEQLLDMSHEQANPKNAVVSLKIAITIYVCVVFLSKDNVASLIPALNHSRFFPHLGNSWCGTYWLCLCFRQPWSVRSLNLQFQIQNFWLIEYYSFFVLMPVSPNGNYKTAFKQKASRLLVSYFLLWIISVYPLTT